MAFHCLQDQVQASWPDIQDPAQHWTKLKWNSYFSPLPLCNYGPANLKYSLFLEDAFLTLCLCASSILLLACSFCISAWQLFHSLKALFKSNYSWLPTSCSNKTNRSLFHYSMVFCAPSNRICLIPSWTYLEVCGQFLLLLFTCSRAGLRLHHI